jgi:hypothetical protein
MPALFVVLSFLAVLGLLRLQRHLGPDTAHQLVADSRRVTAVFRTEVRPRVATFSLFTLDVAGALFASVAAAAVVSIVGG